MMAAVIDEDNDMAFSREAGSAPKP